jgi:DNA invertase Pin-like site-specific DNA recombinase
MPIGLAYSRQSLGQAGETSESSLSLDTQENRIREWADAERWTIAEAFRDHDLRGTTLDRPGWKQVISKVERGGIDAVIVFALSRVARDNLLQETAWRQLKALNVRLISVTEPAAEDNMVRGILGVLSQAERERMGKFISASAQERMRRGTPWGTPLFGFRKGGNPGERNRPTEINPELEPVARTIIDLALAGESPFTIARTLTEEGVPSPNDNGPWRHTTVRRWLRSPGIAGGIQTNRDILWGAYDGVIDRATWERIQQMLAKRAFTRSEVKSDALLRGLVYHGCGKRMVAHKDPVNGIGNVHTFYRCPNTSGADGKKCSSTPTVCSVRKVNAAAIDALKADLAGLLSPQAAKAAWDREHDGQNIAKLRADLVRERSKAVEAAARAEALYLSGKRDAAWLNDQDGVTNERLAQIDEQLAKLDTPPDLDRMRDTERYLVSSATMIERSTEDEIKPLLRVLGYVQLNGDQLSWRYEGEVAMLIPSPSLRRWR